MAKRYKEVFMARKKQSEKPDIISPEYLDRLLATPAWYKVVVENSFHPFSKYLVQDKLISKEQNEQIMDFWKKV